MATDKARHRAAKDEPYGRGSRSDLSEDEESNPPGNPTSLFPRTKDKSKLRHRKSEEELPQIARDFLLKVPRGSYGDSLLFINKNQATLVKSSLVDQYINEAVGCLASNDDKYAENCIEKALLIHQAWRLEKSSDRLAYFKKLQSQKGETFENFRKSFNQMHAQCKSKASSKEKRTHSFSSTGTTLNYEAAIPSSRGYDTANLPQESRRRESFATSAGQGRSGMTGYQTLPNYMANMAVTDSHVTSDPKTRHAVTTEIQQQTTGNRSNPVQSQHTTPYMQSEKRARHTKTISDPRKAKEPSKVDLTKIDGFSNIPGVESKDPAEDELDDRYYRRSAKAAGKLFKVGRVFSVMAHYDYNGDPRSFRKTPEQWLTAGPKGSSIISHIQRYAVVKEGWGFCWAVPISTYGGQATCKPGLSPAEIEAHAIAYSPPQTPKRLEGEQVLPKTPIPINCDEDHRLHPASRINFAKVRTIEHNVRVMNIGCVASSFLDHFHEYWNMEVGKVYPPRRNTRP